MNIMPLGVRNSRTSQTTTLFRRRLFVRSRILTVSRSKYSNVKVCRLCNMPWHADKICDGSFSRFTFDMMLAWEMPSSADESHNECVAKEAEEKSFSRMIIMPTLGPLLGEETLLYIGLFAGFLNMLLDSIAWATWGPYASCLLGIFFSLSSPSIRCIVSRQVGPYVQVKFVATSKATSYPKRDVLLSKTSSMDVSQDQSDAFSVSMDDSMSTCDSLKSPQIEYMDCKETDVVDSIQRKASKMEIAGTICKRDLLSAMDSDDQIVDVDDNMEDPQLCSTMACDIYKHLRASEAKKRPATNFMEKVQKDINPSMRAILIDWLVAFSILNSGLLICWVF